MSKFLIEGLDRLGKSTLTQNIQKKLGFHQMIHMSKPIKCEVYSGENELMVNGDLYRYQRECFKQMFHLLNEPDYKIIFDRAHLGEAVYAPLYRKYSGDYIYELEQFYDMGHRLRADTTLILLTEDFEISKHFVDDGESFDITKREQEQEMFKSAFEKSIIKRKKIVCVTDQALGGFRKQEDILAEVLE